MDFGYYLLVGVKYIHCRIAPPFYLWSYSWSWISPPCWYRSVISLSWRRVCNCLSCVPLFMLPNCIFLCFVAYFCELVTNPSRRFLITSPAGDDILDLTCLLIALAMHVAVLDHMYDDISRSVVVVQFRLVFDLLWLYLYGIYSCWPPVRQLFISTAIASLILLIIILGTLPTLIWLMTIMCVPMSGLYV